MIDMSSIVHINIGLLGAVGIIATLLVAEFKTKAENRWYGLSIILFGLSALFSVGLLIDLIREDLGGAKGVISNYYDVFTYISLLLFLIASEIMIIFSAISFLKKGKFSKRK